MSTHDAYALLYISSPVDASPCTYSHLPRCTALPCFPADQQLAAVAAVVRPSAGENSSAVPVTEAFFKDHVMPNCSFQTVKGMTYSEMCSKSMSLPVRMFLLHARLTVL